MVVDIDRSGKRVDIDSPWYKMNDILWRPGAERVERAAITAFRAEAERRWGVRLPDYRALHDWSIAHRDRFWLTLWDFCGVIAERRGERALVDGGAMPGARWFPDARLNYAENLLRRAGKGDALVFRGENGARRRMSGEALRVSVSRAAQALRASGVGPGDRVAACLPNMPEAAVAMLAAASIGAVWSSCSPDFGERGVLDRFEQIEPKLLLGCDGYFYNGKRRDTRAKLAAIAAALPSAATAVMAFYDEPGAPAAGFAAWDEWLAPFAPRPPEFAQLPFDHPLMVLFSSGTTGRPKGIVHGAGGTLLKHLCEHRLHGGIESGDRVFFFTTCGWMMWNWLMSALASEAALLLYDGSPFYPSGAALFDYADDEGMTHFGTSARFIEALGKARIRPADTHGLAALRAVFSTGSPLAPESFDYVYDAVKRDVCLASISGGTDIVGCFALGNPALPVRRGELQCLALGMAAEIRTESGAPAAIGEKGELVCTKAFPSMPVGFWNDPGGARYRAAYFERFPGIWRHGDYAEIAPSGGMIVHGRSDATLNPGGVRIGTAEIYRQVERLPEVAESLAIGQEWQGDARIVLFVVLRAGAALDDALAARIRAQLRENASPRHVPAKIVRVAAVPRTKSGKLVELAVRDVVHGRPAANREALDDPSVLDLYRNIPELAEP